MSRQQSPYSKEKSAASSTHKVAAHPCRVCGRHGGFGTIKRDVHGNVALDEGADWYCGDHVPWQTGRMRPTWNAKFERAWFDMKKAASGG
jgi:hypothetical protein